MLGDRESDEEISSWIGKQNLCRCASFRLITLSVQRIPDREILCHCSATSDHDSRFNFEGASTCLSLRHCDQGSLCKGIAVLEAGKGSARQQDVAKKVPYGIARPDLVCLANSEP